MFRIVPEPLASILMKLEFMPPFPGGGGGGGGSGGQSSSKSELKSHGSKSTFRPTDSPVPGPSPLGPLALPHQLHVPSTGGRLTNPEPVPEFVMLLRLIKCPVPKFSIDV